MKILAQHFDAVAQRIGEEGHVMNQLMLANRAHVCMGVFALIMGELLLVNVLKDLKVFAVKLVCLLVVFLSDLGPFLL